MNSTHSNLLGLKEKITTNLSGEQITYVLDTFLNRAIKPIIHNTYFMDRYIAELLPFVISNARRKLSFNLTNVKLAEHLFSFLTADSSKYKYKYYVDAKLERSITFSALFEFERLTLGYSDAILDYYNNPSDMTIQAKLHSIMTSVGLVQGSSLFHTVKEAMYWSKQATSFKNMIVEKFVRLAYKESEKNAKATGLSIDRDDLFKDLVLSIPKALDKYSPDKGTLTPYIKWWFFDAVTQHSGRHEYDVSYHIPTNVRKRMVEEGQQLANFSVSLNELSDAETSDDTTESDLIKRQRDSVMRELAAEADKWKVAFLLSGMTYKLKPEDKKLLLATTHSVPGKIGTEKLMSQTPKKRKEQKWRA